MIYLEPNLYVSVNQSACNTHPLPLESGFSNEVYYRVLGAFNASETSEAFLILANDLQQIWFISNRHLKAMGVYSERRELSFRL